MIKYKAICFDVDGTLYPAFCMNRKLATWSILHPKKGKKYDSMRKTFRENQNSFDDLGLGDKDFRYREASMLVKATGSKMSVQEAREWLDRNFYQFLKRYSNSIPYQKDVVETFKKIKNKGLKIGIFSDWPLFNKLERIGVSELSDFKSSSDDAGYLKPNKRCLDFVMDKMGLKPSEILYVGDSYDKDIEGSALSGVDAVLIRKKDDPKYGKALKVFQNWSEFDCWLEKLMEV